MCTIDANHTQAKPFFPTSVLMSAPLSNSTGDDTKCYVWCCLMLVWLCRFCKESRRDMHHLQTVGGFNIESRFIEWSSTPLRQMVESIYDWGSWGLPIMSDGPKMLLVGSNPISWAASWDFRSIRGSRGRLRVWAFLLHSFILIHFIHFFLLFSDSYVLLVISILSFSEDRKSSMPHDDADRLTPLPLPPFFYFFWFSKPEIHAYYSSIVVVWIFLICVGGWNWQLFWLP